MEGRCAIKLCGRGRPGRGLTRARHFPRTINTAFGGPDIGRFHLAWPTGLTLSLDHCQSFSTRAQAELSHFLKSQQVFFLQAVFFSPTAPARSPRISRAAFGVASAHNW